ncbi:MAG TPA: class F sortase [Kocuria rosea]|nr:class F sortase [Kocuria rosea]
MSPSAGPGRDARRAPAHRAPVLPAPGPQRRRTAALGAGALLSAALLAAAAAVAVLPAEGDDAPATAPVAQTAVLGPAAPSLSGQRLGDGPPAPPDPDRVPDPGEVPVAPATQAPVAPLPPPVRVEVDGVPIDMPVVPVGIEDGGAMTLPDNHVQLGWYRHGPAPGAEEGAAVIAGHVDTLTEVTPMARLQDVAPGAEVTVERADGSVLRYRTETVERVHKRSLEDADLFRRTGAPVLHLVTCGGEWLEETGDYEDNVVLRAVPVG